MPSPFEARSPGGKVPTTKEYQDQAKECESAMEALNKKDRPRYWELSAAHELVLLVEQHIAAFEKLRKDDKSTESARISALASARMDLRRLSTGIQGLAWGKDNLSRLNDALNYTIDELDPKDHDYSGKGGLMPPPSLPVDVKEWATTWIANLGIVAKIVQWVWDHYYPLAGGLACREKNLQLILNKEYTLHTECSKLEDDKLREKFRTLIDVLGTSFGAMLQYRRNSEIAALDQVRRARRPADAY